MRTCTDCGETKTLDQFWKDRSKKHGYQSKCKPCKTARFTVYRKANGYDRKRYWNNPEGERERHLIRKYGVTLADYEAMFVAQRGCCAICQKAQERALDVDHNHRTGVVRGLLCTNCNRMIGHANDDPERLQIAANYLSSRKSRKPSSEPS